METTDIRKLWEGATPGWARWDATIAAWMEPATVAMLTMAGVNAGARVLDLACGTGNQTLRAAQRVGAHGHVVASDIADTMLHHVQENARAAGLTNVTTLAGAAEDLEVSGESFDAVICRLGLMLFIDPAKALRVVLAYCDLAASSLLSCSVRLPRIRLWPKPCRSSCATLARRRQHLDNPGFSHLALPA